MAGETMGDPDSTLRLVEVQARFKRLFEIMGLNWTTCKSCGAAMYWITTKNGKSIPYTVNGQSHFADCPAAAQHRRRKP